MKNSYRLFQRLLNICHHFFVKAKTSVEAECKVARSVRRQGERNGMKYLLLCAVPEVTEWKKCSERIRKNAWNEVTGGAGTLNGNFNGEGKGQMYPCNAMKGIRLPRDAQGFSIEQLNWQRETTNHQLFKINIRKLNFYT